MTVASLVTPLMFTFTLSPALSSALAEGLACGAGVAGGVAARLLVLAPALVLALSVLADSQAVRASESRSTAHILVVILNLRLIRLRSPGARLSFRPVNGLRGQNVSSSQNRER